MERAQSQEPARSPEPGASPPKGPSPDPPARAKRDRRSTEDSLAERVAGWIVPQHYPEGVVYGLITIGALLAAESGLRDTYPETVGSAALTIVLYWFAHSYADVLGLRLSKQRRLRSEELWHTFVQDWSIARGASLPLLALLIGWAVGASQATAVTAGVWTVVVSLVA